MVLSTPRGVKAVEASPAIDSGQPLAAAGGITIAPVGTRDPYEALDDLMVVVEALCPAWPTRDTFKAGSLWLLQPRWRECLR